MVNREDYANAIRVLFPAYALRVYLLAQVAGQNYDIEDPVGGMPKDYRRAAQEIENVIEQGYSKMMRLIGERDDE